MKKSENSKILPYTKKQIASVILHPETCNIRGYRLSMRITGLKITAIIF